MEARPNKTDICLGSFFIVASKDYGPALWERARQIGLCSSLPNSSQWEPGNVIFGKQSGSWEKKNKKNNTSHMFAIFFFFLPSLLGDRLSFSTEGLDRKVSCSVSSIVQVAFHNKKLFAWALSLSWLSHRQRGGRAAEAHCGAPLGHCWERRAVLLELLCLAVV